MRNWYWTEKSRNTDARLLETLKRFSLCNYEISKELSPTVKEIARFTPKSRLWSLLFFEKGLDYGLDVTYYDGFHVSLNLYFICICWSY